jgi:multicomponent Na+:H+ antiporter subunit D
MMIDFPPALILFVGAAALCFVSGRARWAVGLAVPMLALAHAWVVIGRDGGPRIPFMGMELAPVHVHAATPAFATIFCIMLAGGALFALNQNRRAELAAAFVYAGGALGVAFAGDLVTLIVAWEVMMLGSTVIIWSGGPRSGGAGIRYFCLHALGGAVMLIGIVITAVVRANAGDPSPLAFSAMPGLLDAPASLAGAGAWLILLGMLLCAGAPPFSAWLSDAYPRASFTGSVFLSAFTTKAAVFALIVAFAGFEPLIWIGLCMTFYGIVYAILENDIRRVLSYSIVNQVGFMLVGVGVGTQLAIDGATAHAFAHIIYKALLMMTAGSVIYATGRDRCTDLGGLYRSMPLTTACCIIGALAISSFPLTSGFTTKSMIDDSVVAHAAVLAGESLPTQRLMIAWFLLEVASAGVFLHAGIKFPWFVFFAKDSGLRPPDPPWNMRAAMILFAGLCIFIGVFPGLLYDILPYRAAATDYLPVVYSFTHVMEMLGLLVFGAAAFFFLVAMLARKRTISLDIDWLWRRFIPALRSEVAAPLRQSATRAVRATRAELTALGATLPHKPKGLSVVRESVAIVLVLLLAYLLVFAFMTFA